MAGYMGNPDYEPSMFVDQDQAKDLVDDNTVVVVVDTNKPSYTECQELLVYDEDHRRAGSPQKGQRGDRKRGACPTWSPTRPPPARWWRRSCSTFPTTCVCGTLRRTVCMQEL